MPNANGGLDSAQKGGKKHVQQRKERKKHWFICCGYIGCITCRRGPGVDNMG